MGGAPATATGIALPPLEARLLAAAAQDPLSPRPYLELAEQYAASARPASALWAYAEAAARAPGDASIQWKISAALRQFGYPAVAESLLRSLAAGPGPVAAAARLDLADLLLATGRPAAASAVLRGAGSPAALARGRAAEAAGELPAARQFYGRDGAAGDGEGYERLARLELAAGDAAAARAALQTLDRMGAARPEDLLLVARVDAAFGTRRELNAAAVALAKYLQLRPSDAAARDEAGLLFLQKGDRGAARDQFARAVTLDPNDAASRARLADLLQKEGQIAQAHRQRAAYYEIQDQPDRSLAELRQAGQAGDQDDLKRTLMAVRTASEQQQLLAAVKEAEAGLKRHPGESDLLLQLGLLYQTADSRAALEQLCRDWIARQPASGRPYWLLGRRAVVDAREAEAIRLFETACAREPNQVDFWVAQGEAYLKEPAPENLVKARNCLEKAVTMNARSDAAHLQLGYALERAGRLDEARRQYLDSLDIAPEQTMALNNVAQVSFRLRQPAVARLFASLAQAEEERTRQRQHLFRQVRDHPDDAAARIEFARFLIRNGQLDAARNQLQRAAEPGPAAPQARALLTQVERWLRVQSG